MALEVDLALAARAMQEAARERGDGAGARVVDADELSELLRI